MTVTYSHSDSNSTVTYPEKGRKLTSTGRSLFRCVHHREVKHFPCYMHIQHITYYVWHVHLIWKHVQIAVGVRLFWSFCAPVVDLLFLSRLVVIPLLTAILWRLQFSIDYEKENNETDAPTSVYGGGKKPGSSKPRARSLVSLIWWLKYVTGRNFHVSLVCSQSYSFVRPLRLMSKY